MKNSMTFVSSVALYGNGLIEFGGANIRSVLPKSGNKLPSILFTSNPLAEKDPKAVFVGLSVVNDLAIKKVGVPVLDGSAVVVCIQTKIVFSEKSGKAYNEVVGFSAPNPKEVERLVAAVKEAEAVRLAKNSAAKLEEANSFFKPAADSAETSTDVAL